MELKTVFRAFNSAEAQLVRAQLEAAEFDVFVADESSALAVECYVLGVKPRNIAPGSMKNFGFRTGRGRPRISLPP